ncbi:MAG TPA: response regulator [Spirochaetales bacterium]|nr:response regulator [Spirochaetales bacterium]HRY53216.1 response regulator [Spirochaetia bacterium]HRZ64137.1 response regulator [Spirochaetia bacterium]
MWKVLIADDEPKIRRGLRSLVGRCRDLEVVAEAEDGELAYELALEHEPDILLVDVRMPFKNGLELIEEINAALPGRIFIIVSGHDEFEYAQAAVKLRVFDYVLKPVDAESFVAVIERAAAELESRKEDGKYAAWAREQLERNLPVLRERFLKDWVSGSLSRTEVLEGLSFLRIELSSPSTLVAARFPERSPSGSAGGERSRRLALVALRTLLEEALPAGTYVFEDETETLLALAPALPEARLADAAGEVERRAGEQVFQSPSVATRAVPDPAAGICDAYDELRAELADGDNCEAFVVLARNYVDKHYWNPELCLEDAAAELQISPGYLSRLMKRETGFSFVEYLNRIRVRKAAVLMSDPAAKAFEVAERVGYRSQHYFSRAFKKVTGTTPTDHRKGPAS